MYITKDNGKDNLTSGGAHRERTSWLEDSHLFANSYQDDHVFLHKHHQQCHPHSPLQQTEPWNQSLVALGRSAAPRCRLTSANLDFGFLNTCQQSEISQITRQQSQISQVTRQQSEILTSLVSGR